MERTLAALLFFVVVVVVNCFNFETQDPIVKRGEAGSYFGYSVAEHITDDRNVKWLLVGAPIGRNLQPGTNRSGALFKCPITENSPFDCTQVETDGRKPEAFDYEDDEADEKSTALNPPTHEEIKDGQWLGVVVRSQKPGGKVMVCAHRYITGFDLSQTQHGLGLCYSLKTNLDWDSPWEPCKGRPMASEHQQFGYCQAGTSLALLKDGTALIGSPGPYTWRGTMFVLQVVGDFLHRDKNMYLGPLNDKSEPINKYSYLGMSVTAGNFFSKNITTYAAGAPRSQHHGQVYVFQKQQNEVIMNIMLVIDGYQFASNFGYEILSVDINRDGYDELLVAAPFYYNKTVGGAVYIYYNLRNCSALSCRYDQMLVGPTESRFGFSMTSLGDINKDGYVDIAIGAPYESPNGAIYIYLGGKDGLELEPSQKIKVSGVTTLGYSLSGGLDMDDNGYPDLLTGAYDSDMAILFRTKAIIHIDIEVKGKELRNIDASRVGCTSDPSSTRTCFSFEICFKLRWPENYSKAIYVRSFIEADIDKRRGKFARVKFNTTSDNPHKEQHFRFRKTGTEYVSRCQQELVYIKEGNRDILSPIKFNVSYTLTNNETLSPILNQTSVKEFVATFLKDCGSDDRCLCDLRLTAGLGQLKKREDDGNVYMLDLGSVDELNVDVNITNRGESAYEAQLFVVHPVSISYIALNDKQSDIKCTYFNDSLVTCNLGNPFQKEKSINLVLRFESKDNNKLNKVKELAFRVFVNSTSEELSDQTSSEFRVEVKKRAEVKITGAATSYVIFGGAVKGESAISHFDEIGSRVWHTYQVSNDGPWTVDNVQVKIAWPMQVASPWAQGKWLLYLEDIPKVEYDGTLYDWCTISPPFMVNELNFTNRPGGIDAPPENYMLPPHNQDISPDAPAFLRANHEVRRRRQAAYTMPESCSDKKRNCTLDCHLGTAKCAQITCELPKLLQGNEATIQIKSRVWNSTLVEDFKKKDFVKIVSRAAIFIPDESVEQDPLDDEAKADTTAYPETTAQETAVPLWIYIVSILAGILAVLLISFILYKCGFFKRNRVKDPTLSGNLMKVSESESLLNK